MIERVALSTMPWAVWVATRVPLGAVVKRVGVVNTIPAPASVSPLAAATPIRAATAALPLGATAGPKAQIATDWKILVIERRIPVIAPRTESSSHLPGL